MKKVIFLMLAMVLAVGLALPPAEAKPYKAVRLTDCRVDVPDSFVLPFDPGALVLAKWTPIKLPNGDVLVIDVFIDPSFQYLGKNEEGNVVEVFPYVEVLKMEGDKIHVVAIFFINKDGNTEAYIDTPGYNGPAGDKLEKADDIGFFKGVVKVPRQKKE